MNYQNILSHILWSGGPVVASSNLVIPTVENQRLTIICKSFLFAHITQNRYLITKKYNLILV